MTARTVDALLDERSRLTTQLAGVNGHLWAAEFLVHRMVKLLPHLIADSPHNAVALETLGQEMRELLAEDRPHPGAGIELPGGGDTSEGEVGVALPSGDGHVDV